MTFSTTICRLFYRSPMLFIGSNRYILTVFLPQTIISGKNGQTVALPIAVTTVWHDTGVPPLYTSLIATCCSFVQESTVPGLFTSTATRRCTRPLFSATTLSYVDCRDEVDFSLYFQYVIFVFICRTSGATTFCPDVPFSPRAHYRHGEEPTYLINCLQLFNIMQRIMHSSGGWTMLISVMSCALQKPAMVQVDSQETQTAKKLTVWASFL